MNPCPTPFGWRSGLAAVVFSRCWYRVRSRASGASGKGSDGVPAAATRSASARVNRRQIHPIRRAQIKLRFQKNNTNRIRMSSELGSVKVIRV